MVEGRYKPTKVTASATTGIATSMGCDSKTEDTITLLVDWQNLSDPNQRGTAVYTASWAAPLKAGVHSEQRFHYMAAKGEVRVDQAHRGYSVVEDDVGKLDVSLSFLFCTMLIHSTTPSTSSTLQVRTLLNNMMRHQLINR
jgi:D-galacturonate reductase